MHNTLNQAIEAAGISPALWPLGLNLRYGETGRVVTNGIFISVYRDGRGLYETAITYASECDDSAHVLREVPVVPAEQAIAYMESVINA